MLRLVILGTLLLTLTACGTARVPLAANDDAVCREMGAQPGTDVYVQCRLQQQARRDAAPSLGQRLQRAGAAMQQSDAPRSINCTTRPTIGGQTQTTCN